MAKPSKAFVKECKRRIGIISFLEYGDPNHVTMKPCQRVTGSKIITIFHTKWTVAEIAFIAHYERYPKTQRCKMDLSHICGNSKCITIEHIKEESHSDNCDRESCHCIIRKYEEKIYRNLAYSQKTKTPGPLYMNDIPLSAYSILFPQSKTNKKYNKRKDQKEKEDKHRERYRKQFKKEYIAPKKKTTPFKCKHEPRCFINFNKKLQQKKSSNNNDNNNNRN